MCNHAYKMPINFASVNTSVIVSIRKISRVLPSLSALSYTMSIWPNHSVEIWSSFRGTNEAIDPNDLPSKNAIVNSDTQTLRCRGHYHKLPLSLSFSLLLSLSLFFL